MGEELLVFTYWGNGDRIQQDLRHELTHALLNSALRSVPLWLDEGLAEYFEIPPSKGGFSPEHIKQLRHGPNGPLHADLNRLEQLKDVNEMTPAEYREAWAWVHFMLHGNDESRKVLVSYLKELRTEQDARPAAHAPDDIVPLAGNRSGPAFADVGANAADGGRR